MTVLVVKYDKLCESPLPTGFHRPPQYPEVFKAFLALGGQAVRSFATVVLTLPINPKTKARIFFAVERDIAVCVLSFVGDELSEHFLP